MQYMCERLDISIDTFVCTTASGQSEQSVEQTLVNLFEFKLVCVVITALASVHELLYTP